MANDYARWLADAEEARRRREANARARAANNLRNGKLVNPAAAAAGERAARRLGLTPIPAEAPELVDEAHFQETMDELSKSFKAVQWLSDDPNNAVVAHDKVKELTFMERWVGAMRQLTNTTDEDLLSERYFAAGVVGDFIGRGLEGIGVAAERATARLGADANGPVGTVQWATGLNAINALGGLARDVGAANRRAGAYLRGEEGSERSLRFQSLDVLPRMEKPQGAEGFALDVASGLGQVGGAILTGGSSLPMLFGSGVSQAHESVEEAQKREGRVGEYSDRDDLALTAGGLWTTATERVGLKGILGKYKLPPALDRAMGNAVARVAIAGGGEMASEAAENIGQNAISRYILGNDTALVDGSLAYEAGVAGFVGSIANVLVQTAVPGRQHVANADRAARATQQHEAFRQAVDGSINSELRKQSPERYRDFLQSIDPDGEVLVPAEKVAEFFQSHPDLDQWMDEWDIRDQVEEALVAGTDVVIPRSTYLAQVAGTEAHQAWADDIRFGLNEMSPREAAQFAENGEAQTVEAIDEAIDKAVADAPVIEAEARVYDDVRRQLREAGYTVDAANTQARLVATTSRVLAERNPEVFADAWAAYQDNGLQVRQEFPEVVRRQMDRLDVMIEALRRGRSAPSQKRMFGRSMMEFLASRGGVIDSGGELAAMNVDVWHNPRKGGKAFRRRFIRESDVREGIYEFDGATQAAIEEGYLPEGATQRDLLDAIREELAGRPRFSQQREVDNAAIQNREGLDELERLIGDLGLDINDDVETIRAALDRAASEPSDFPGDANYDPNYNPAMYDQSGQIDTNSEAFKAWAGTDEVLDPEEINETDFSGEGPFVMRVYHGTTHDFDVFDASQRGTKEGQFGAVNYFTSSFSDADRNYAGEGPDLTNRIQRRAEQIESETDGDVDGDQAVEQARQELAGENPQTLEVYVRTEKPFVVGGDASPFMEFVDFEALEAKAIEIVAENNDITPDDVRADLDAYQDEIDDARWEAESETENPLLVAIQTVADRHGIDPSQIFEDVAEFSSEGGRHSDIEQALRASEGLAYAEDAETGDLIGYHVLGEIIQELGFDSIILKNAESRFSSMDMEYGTAHIHVFDANNTNIKSVNNRGTFDPNDPVIYNQSDAPTNPPFFSALKRAVEESKTAKAPASQWKATLAKTPGVKAEELEWTGLNEWLDMMEGSVERAAILRYLDEGGIQLEEVELGGRDPDLERELTAQIEKDFYDDAIAYFLEQGDSEYRVEEGENEDGETVWQVLRSDEDFDPESGDSYESEADARYALHEYQREEAEEYARARVASETYEIEQRVEDAMLDQDGTAQYSDYKLPGADETYREFLLKLPVIRGERFQSSEGHFDDQHDVIAHARFTTREDTEGRRILFLEEVQSTHHETGREQGYKQEVTPEQLEEFRAARTAAMDDYKAQRALMVPVGREIMQARIEGFKQRLEQAEAENSEAKFGVLIDRLKSEIRNAERTLDLLHPEADDIYWDRGLRDAFTAPRSLTAIGAPALTDEQIAMRTELQDRSLRVTEAEGAEMSLREGVEPAPWMKSWSQLVMKRMIRYAVDNGFDGVAWINGNQQNGGKTGGDGSWFYERNLVNETNAILKKLGSRVEKIEMFDAQTAARVEDVRADLSQEQPRWSFPETLTELERPAQALGVQNGFYLTDKIKEQAAQGFTLFQNKDTGPRGQVALSEGRAIIRLFASRDMSTFTHEMGHVWLEQMRRLFRNPNASPQIKADFQIVLDWFSAEAGRPITDADIGTDQHELWARGIERYMMEGKSPSVGMRDVFRTVMAWMKRVYSVVTNLNAPISDEVRGVMDRLFATDAEIEQAQVASGSALGPILLQEMGATDAEVSAYRATVERARSDAEDELLQRVMSSIRRMRTAEWREAADAIRDEVAADVDAMRDMIALDIIKRHGSMDRDAVVSILGDEAGLALLPRGVPPLYSAKGGQHPDMVAEAAGYRSGSEMLYALMEMKVERDAMREADDKRSVRQKRIDDRIRETLLDRYGDILNDGSIEQEAVDAIHSERYTELLAVDLRVLGRKTGNTPAPIDALRQWAKDRIGARRVRDVRPGKYLRAERTASNAVQKALAAGNRDEAFRQKQAQTINNVLYVEAGKAQRETDAVINRLRRLGSKNHPSIHVDYMEQIEAILDQYELRRVSGRTIQRRQSLADFVKAQEEAGQPINIPAEVIAATQKRNLEDLTVDEIRGLGQAVANLEHLGRMKMKLKVGKEQRDLDAAADQAWASAQALPDVKGSEAPGSETWFERMQGYTASFEASLVKAREYMRLLDGGDPMGIWAQTLDVPGIEAANKRAELQAEFWNPVQEAYQAIPAERRRMWMDNVSDHPFVNPNTGQTFGRLKHADLIGAALHVGTLSNFEKMAKGYGIVPLDADPVAVAGQRQAFVAWLDQRLTAEEWDYVQSIWDAHDRLKPQYFAVSRETEGFEPEAVEAEPVVLADRTLKGGYAPISYHSSYDQGAQRREQREASDMFGGLMASGPRPDNGSTNARTSYVGAVRLGLEDARFAAEKQITYTAYAVYIQNSLKFLQHPVVSQTIKRKLGIEAYRTFEPWLANQVKDETITDPGSNAVLRVVRTARVNMTASVLLGSATVLLSQPGGLAQSSVYLGPKWLAKGVAHAMSMGGAVGSEMRDFITSRSEFMRLRLEDAELDRDYRQAMTSQGRSDRMAGARVIVGKATGWVDFYATSGPTWLGAYDKAMSEGREESEAIYLADLAVRTTQGGGRPIDQAGVQHKNEVTKMFTFAYGWANAYYNMQRAAWVDFKNGNDRLENAIKLSSLLILPHLLDAALTGDWPEFLKEMMQGEMPEDWRQVVGDTAEWFGRNVLFGAFAGVPFVRDAAGSLERRAAGEYSGSVGQTAIGRFSDEVLSLTNDAWTLVTEGPDEVSDRWTAHLLRTAGLAFGIPGTAQVVRTSNYLLDVADGDQNPETFADWMTGLLRGPQDEQR